MRQAPSRRALFAYGRTHGMSLGVLWLAIENLHRQGSGWWWLGVALATALVVWTTWRCWDDV